MSEIRGITNLSYPEFKERVPRLDHQIRIVCKVVDLLYKNAVDTAFDIIKPTHMHHDENRMQYVARRGEERAEKLESETEIYIFEKRLGTETARTIIRFKHGLED